MIHPASHCPLLVLSRSDGRSAVAAAAYVARTRMNDQRTGLSYNYRSTPGLLAEGLINWKGSAEALWNAAEQSEKRMNSRVARELRPALPAELPLNEQRRLVHGFSCWLKDEFGVAVHWVIHAPNFHDKALNRRLSRDRKCEDGERKYLAALNDPNLTNLNYHAHIRFTTRRVDFQSATFREKTRELDGKKTGAQCVVKIRGEWQRRTNAALARVGSEARIDLRSYKTMAAEGDAPHGLQAQQHAGPKQTARNRARQDREEADGFAAVSPRDTVQKANEEKWICWLEIRRLEREKMRVATALQIAEKRELDRKNRVLKEKKRIAEAKNAEEQRAAIDAATSIDQIGAGDDMLAAALTWARSGTGPTIYPNDADGQSHKPDQPAPRFTKVDEQNFDEPIDPETFSLPSVDDPFIKRRRIRRHNSRGRGQRVRG
ncbi:MobA/MobL family protein [Sulfitobacter sp. CS16]|uniref:MobA/MobL family protein n=1 Tax=Sulfitobacter sp. CS16 TaxID=3368573 RepID=UPI0037463123